MVSLEFFIDIILPARMMAPGVDSASNRNEYQEYFLRSKGGRCLRLTTLYNLPVSIVLKSGSLKFLEPSGPVQACNGIALPFYIQRGYLALKLYVSFEVRKSVHHHTIQNKSTNKMQQFHKFIT